MTSIKKYKPKPIKFKNIKTKKKEEFYKPCKIKKYQQMNIHRSKLIFADTCQTL